MSHWEMKDEQEVVSRVGRTTLWTVSSCHCVFNQESEQLLIYLPECSEQKQHQHNTLNNDFHDKGFQGMKDNDPGNTWGYPKECPSSLPWENFQAQTRGEGMEAELARLPDRRWWSWQSGEPKWAEITDQNPGEERVEQREKGPWRSEEEPLRNSAEERTEPIWEKPSEKTIGTCDWCSLSPRTSIYSHEPGWKNS